MEATTEYGRASAAAPSKAAWRKAGACRARLERGVRGRSLDDRGDVPGWVLITLMTAGLVTVIWAVAGPMLVDLFSSAISGVTGG